MALEEKQIPYDCVLIDLRNKPAWFKRKVPTTLVPAAVIRDSSGSTTLTWESLDIMKVVSCSVLCSTSCAWHTLNKATPSIKAPTLLQKLEEHFPERPLLPRDEAKRKEAMQVILAPAACLHSCTCLIALLLHLGRTASQAGAGACSS